MTANNHSQTIFSAVGLPKALLSGGAIALLLLSWGALFRFILLEMELLLPYDTSWHDYWGWPQGSPPPGSWQRGLNYFLETPVGSALPASIVVVISVLLLGIVLFRNPQLRKAPLPLLLSFAATNLISIPLMFLASYIAASSVAGGLTGWIATMATGLPACLLLVFLFAAQGWLVPKWLKRKKDA